MTVKVWWLGGSDGKGNFGDVLTPYILKHFNIDYQYTKLYRNSNLLCVGSIARRANENMTILGSGIISRNDRLSIFANWMLVRGPYTRNRILNLGGTCAENYGDPALILPLLCDESKKEIDVGIIPHHIDYSLIKEKYSTESVIQLRHLENSPLDTAREITKHRQIISSSLHGIIAAHAYGIPAAWIDSENKLKGDDVKFYDYFASVGIDNPQKSNIKDPIFTLPKTDLKDTIIKSFEKFKNEIAQ